MVYKILPMVPFVVKTIGICQTEKTRQYISAQQNRVKHGNNSSLIYCAAILTIVVPSLIYLISIISALTVALNFNRR